MFIVIYSDSENLSPFLRPYYKTLQLGNNIIYCMNCSI